METEHCQPNGLNFRNVRSGSARGSSPGRRHCDHCLLGSCRGRCGARLSVGRRGGVCPTARSSHTSWNARCSMLHLISVPSPFAEGTPPPSEARLLLHPGVTLHPGGSVISLVLPISWATGFTSAKGVKPREPVSGGISARAARKEVPRLECAELSRPTDWSGYWGAPPPMRTVGLP